VSVVELLTVVFAGVAAVAALLTVRTARETLTTIKGQHEEQMRDRERAYDAELRLQRIAQTERVLEVAIEIRDTADLASRGETRAPDQLPPLSAKLLASLKVLISLRGSLPESGTRLAAEALNRDADTIKGIATEVIAEITTIFATDTKLQL
jgi:hypothetical protein